MSSEYEIGYSTVLKWVQGTTPISPGGLTPDEAKVLKKQLKIQAEEIVILKKSTRPAGKELEVIELIRQESEAGHHSIFRASLKCANFLLFLETHITEKRTQFFPNE